jgi:hypothetical protein
MLPERLSTVLNRQRPDVSSKRNPRLLGLCQLPPAADINAGFSLTLLAYRIGAGEQSGCGAR